MPLLALLLSLLVSINRITNDLLHIYNIRSLHCTVGVLVRIFSKSVPDKGQDGRTQCCHLHIYNLLGKWVAPSG